MKKGCLVVFGTIWRKIQEVPCRDEKNSMHEIVVL
jgi:hypothetical protein